MLRVPAVRALSFLLLSASASASACGNSSAAPPPFPDATTVLPGQKQDTGIVLMMSTTSPCSTDSANRSGCPCTMGQTVACYTGPPSTRNVGSCMDGSQSCQVMGEFSLFGTCTGQVLPSSPTSCGDIPIPDAATDAVAVNFPCTTGDVLPGPDAGAGAGGQVYYCDTDGTWELIPSGACSPSACLACLTANCLSTTVDSLDTCAADLKRVFTWYSKCGPDRASYPDSIGTTCTDTSTDNVGSCKDQYCVNFGPDASMGGPCSLY